MTIGQKIKSFREAKGWSQETAADKLNISYSAYSKIERDITDITYSRLVQIAKLFGISLTKLVSLEESEFEKKLKQKEVEIAELQKKLIKCLEKKK